MYDNTQYSFPRNNISTACVIGIENIANIAAWSSYDAGVSFLFITGFAGPGTDFGGAVGEGGAVCIVRTRRDDSRMVATVVGISAFAFG